MDFLFTLHTNQFLMRKLLFYLFLATSILLLPTCDDSNDNCEDMLWDFVNYEIYFTAIDADGGANLFDTNNPNNLLDDGVWITFRDKTYNIVDWTHPESATTKASYVRPFALRYYPASLVLPHYLSQTMGFGEFGPSSYKKEPFTIHWADGTIDEVQLDCYLTWKDCEPTVHKALYLNGKLVSNDSYPTLHFVKERKKTE